MRFRVQFLYDDKHAGFTDRFSEDDILEYFCAQHAGYAVARSTLQQVLARLKPGEKYKLQHRDMRSAALILRRA
jgi:hypothetical protein